MTLADKLNIFTLVFIPIFVVFIGRWLQDRSEKRKDKMQILKTVMTFRYSWSREGVDALNSIPIVYSGRWGDKKVRDCWKEYYKQLCIQNPDELQVKQRNNALYKLLLSMSEVLGYKDEITWEDIQNPYIPTAMANSINYNELIQSGMASIVQEMVRNHPKDNNND